MLAKCVNKWILFIVKYFLRANWENGRNGCVPQVVFNRHESIFSRNVLFLCVYFFYHSFNSRFVIENSIKMKRCGPKHVLRFVGIPF